MNRGVQVFNSLFEDEQIAVVEATKPQNCSRDAQLIAARNEFLFHRFYFKSKVQRKLYGDCLSELKEEVFLSKITLQKLIQANAEQILHIKKLAPDNDSQRLKYFQKKFPWVNWV